ncbi:MAG: polysaccharide biosynthesis/export family protein [Bacteroidota bacterium]|nr:polysaccharide biosynthesis/export family protein [Bacteroidota bacterium]
MSNIRNQNKLKFEKLFILIFLAGLLLSSISCVTNKQMVYVQEEKEERGKFETIEKQDRLIQTDDELYIRISSEDEQTNIFEQRTDYDIARADITLVSYLVNEEGFIRLPPIGDIQLMGLKLDEASNVIEMALVGLISSPAVSIKLVNKTVTVLGEVREPGRYEFYDQRINIFQALGYAGDIAEYGNRKKIMLIREEKNTITRHYIDLTDEDLLASYYYYVKPNDVIYVEPLRRRFWGINNFPFSLILASVSTFVLVMSYINLYSGGN